MATTYGGRWRASTYLTPDYGEKLEEIAAGRGLSVSKLLEEYVTAAIDRHDDTPVAT